MKAIEGFVVDNQMCVALNSASRAMTSAYRPFLDEIGLTHPQYTVMMMLWEQQSVTLHALGHRLDLDSGTLSPLLKRLERHGLLTRRRRPEDERTMQVTVTAKGMGLRDRAAEAQAHVASATGLDSKAFAELRETLQALARRLRAASLSASQPGAACPLG